MYIIGASPTPPKDNTAFMSTGPAGAAGCDEAPLWRASNSRLACLKEAIRGPRSIPSEYSGALAGAENAFNSKELTAE